MGEKRNVKRLRKRMQVHFTLKDVTGTGFTENLAPGGLLIHSNITFPPKSRISGRLIPSQGAAMAFEAEIRWVRKTSGPLSRITKSSMGVTFVSAPDEAYYKLLTQKLEDGEA